MKGYNSYDTSLIKVVKPSTTTGETKTTDAIDLGEVSNIGVRSETFELEVQIPAYDATELVDGATLTIGLETSDNADFSNALTIVQADYGDGESNGAKSIRVKPTLDSQRFWRAFVKTTLNDSATIEEGVAEKAIIFAYVC